MEEMALAILSVLLQRNPDLKLSPADIAFLRPPGAPPLATVTGIHSPMAKTDLLRL